MAESVIANIKTANRGFEFSCEFKKFPVAFVNALRRIVLADIPTVVLSDVVIIENTSQLPHEMVRHRVEMLPVNVLPDNSDAIKNGKVELHIAKATTATELTTDDFAVKDGAALMKDRDIDEPILFLRLRVGEAIHIRASLSVATAPVKQVCNVRSQWHIDDEIAKVERKKWVDATSAAGADPRQFDNFEILKCYSRDANGRPDWIDFSLESVGVMAAKDIFRIGVGILRRKIDEYMKEAVENIKRVGTSNAVAEYEINIEQGGHTIGALVQAVIYSDLNVSFVSYDIPHPLKNDMKIRFAIASEGIAPEKILRSAKETIYNYCSIVEKVL